MLHRRLMTGRSATPLSPISVVIEDPRLAVSGERLDTPGSIEVHVCSGPSSDDEVCPLVTEGVCPFGSCDVVVCSLAGVWAAPVQAAWRDAGVPVTAPSGSSWEGASFREALGSAYQALFLAAHGLGDTGGELWGVPVLSGGKQPE